MRIAHAVPLSLALVATSQAAVVTYSGDTVDRGAGFGNVMNLLAVQDAPREAGAVLWNGSRDLLTGNAKNQSQTRSVSELLEAGFGPGRLSVVFNINEPGSASGRSVTLQAFELCFQNEAGGTLFEARYSGALTLVPVNNGVGGSGYRFDVALTPQEAAIFFSDPANRLGMKVSTPILETAAGPENFYLIPGPGAAALLGLGALSLGRRRR